MHVVHDCHQWVQKQLIGHQTPAGNHSRSGCVCFAHTCASSLLPPPPSPIVTASGAGALVHLSQPRSPGWLHHRVDPLDPDTLAPNCMERPPGVPHHPPPHPNPTTTNATTSQVHSLPASSVSSAFHSQPGEAEPSQMGPLVPTTGAHAFVVKKKKKKSPSPLCPPSSAFGLHYIHIDISEKNLARHVHVASRGQEPQTAVTHYIQSSGVSPPSPTSPLPHWATGPAVSRVPIIFIGTDKLGSPKKKLG